MVIRLLLRSAILAAMVGCCVYVVMAERPSKSLETNKCQIPIYKGRDADRKAKILAKPEPKYTAAERRKYRGEIVTLRVVLCGSGEVMEITVKSGVALPVDEKAVDAA